MCRRFVQNEAGGVFIDLKSAYQRDCFSQNGINLGGPSKMNILLTGGTGIGSYTAVVLAEQKHNVICMII